MLTVKPLDEDAPGAGRVLGDRKQDEAEAIAHCAKQRVDAEADPAEYARGRRRAWRPDAGRHRLPW